MKYIIVLFLTFSIILICQDAFTDVLYLKSGGQRKGKVVSQDENKTIFRVGGAEDGVDITFFSDEILRIDKTDVPDLMQLPFTPQGPGFSIPRPIMQTEPLFTDQIKAIEPEVQEDEQADSDADERGIEEEKEEEIVEIIKPTTLIADIPEQPIEAAGPNTKKEYKPLLNDLEQQRLDDKKAAMKDKLKALLKKADPDRTDLDF